jgi:hypothetical protein
MKANFLFCITALALAICISSSAHADNLIVNGSFEDITNFIPNGDDTMVLPLGSTAMPGWTVVGQDGSTAWIGPTNPFSGLTASDGSYFLDLTAYRDAPPYGAVTQTIATTPGVFYQLSFDLGSSLFQGIPDGILATAGSTSENFISTLVGTNQWQTETMIFEATDTSTVITLTGSLASYSNIGLDNVNVHSVPGPIAGAGLPGLIFASGGLLAWWRRKRSAQSVA